MLSSDLGFKRDSPVAFTAWPLTLSANRPTARFINPQTELSQWQLSMNSHRKD